MRLITRICVYMHCINVELLGSKNLRYDVTLIRQGLAGRLPFVLL